MYIAVYARQSIDKVNSVSIETQVEYCKATLPPDERRMTIRCFADKGYSGKDTNRPAFQKLMQDVRRGSVSKIVVYKFDRVSRSIIDFSDMLQVFKSCGVTFVSAQESFDTGSPYGEMICKILMIFAEFERASIIGRIQDAYEKRSDLGLYPGGRKIYGYDLEDAVIGGIRTRRFVENPAEAAQVRFLYDTYALPGVTLRQLQDELLARGMRPLCGKDWTTGKLSSLLRNPVYVCADEQVYHFFAARNARIIGDLRDFDGTRSLRLFGRTKHDRNLEDWSDLKVVLLESYGIVGADCWLRCQQKLLQNRQIGNATANHTSWLGGKLVCAKCGHTMTTVKGASRRYFLCAGKSHKKTCTGVKATLYVEDLETLLDACICRKLQIQTESSASRSRENAAQLHALRQQAAEIDAQLAGLGDAVIASGVSPELLAVLNARARSLTAERQQILERMDALSAAPEIADTDLVRQWRRASFSKKRAVCDLLIKAVVIAENGDPEIIWTV